MPHAPYLPPTIELALEREAALVISISGGKDSHALIRVLTHLYQDRGYRGPILAVHADLGRIEWPQSQAMCRKMAADSGIDLQIVRRTDGADFVDLCQRRRETLARTGRDAPFWPSSSARYCTSDLKRGPIDKLLRQYKLVISAEGIRADESDARAEKVPLTVRKQITAKALRDLAPAEALAYRSFTQRAAYTWYPLHEWTIEDVWTCLGTSSADLDRRRGLYREGHEDEALDGWPAHPCYVFGSTRCSCVACVLASRNDIIVGCRHNRDVYQTLCKMEQESGWRFTQDLALSNLNLD